MEDRIHFLNTRQDMREYAKAYEYIIVKFTAPWCQPCKNINPLFMELFLKLPEKFICVVVNIDNGKDLSNALRIRSVPTFLNFIKGNMEDVCVGSNKEQLIDFFKKSQQRYINSS